MPQYDNTNETYFLINEESTATWYPFRFNDNFPIRIKDRVYLNTALVYNLLRFSNDKYIQNDLLRHGTNPGDLKKFLKRLRSREHPGFGENRLRILEWLLRLKFAQHYMIVAAHFAETEHNVISIFKNRIENREVVYYSKHEGTFLGTSKSENVYSGKNHYGIIVSKLRDEFNAENNSLKNVDNPGIDWLRILGRGCNVGYQRRDSFYNKKRVV